MSPRLPRRREDRPAPGGAPSPPPRPVPLPPSLGALLRAGPLPPGMPDRPDETVFVLPEPAGRRAREVVVPLAAALGARIVDNGTDAGGAGTAVAVGWRAVAPVLRAPEVGARALLAVDHEPDLAAPASSEARWAADAYRHGLPAVTTGAWLAQTLTGRYGIQATPFTPGIDHATFAPLPVLRREDLVLLVARPRQALALGVLAIGELLRRRPELEVAVIGEQRPLDLPFPHRHLGTLPPAERAGALNGVTAAFVPALSVPPASVGELMACAVPLVLPDTPAARDLGPAPVLAEHDPTAVADALERLVDDAEDRSDRTRAGLAAAQEATWEDAAATVADALLRAA